MFNILLFKNNIFNAFKHTFLDKCKVIIIGQDIYLRGSLKKYLPKQTNVLSFRYQNADIYF